MRLNRVLILSSALVFPMLVDANPIESEAAVHAAAHVGASYAITHGSEVLCRRITKGSKLVCTLVGASLAATAGIVKETMDGAKDNHKRGLAEDAIGIGLGTVMISIDF